MKVLIDVSYETYKRARRNSAYGIATDVEKAVANGKVLDEMTNKEIMCSLYPDKIYGVSELKHEGSNICDVTFEVERTSEDWWNEPYRKVEE